MKVTYIAHSGFLLETDQAYYLFDYYKGQIPNLSDEKPLLVFVSHHHEDHFNPVIFDLAQRYAHVTYILPYDIPMKKWTERLASLTYHVMRANEIYSLEVLEIEIHTLKSTDAGVAYLVKEKKTGHTYYHAGDLNLWIWEGATKQYNNNMKALYAKEAQKLCGMSVDVAFVPMDPRLLSGAFLGVESFLSLTDVRYLFPMHCWDSYGIINRYLREHPADEKIVQRVTGNQQTFVLP